MFDPWYKSTFQYSALGKNLKIQIPHDVFSTQRIDEGTLLLLDHLPTSEPKSILDMGCGYGALGLPIAAKFSNAKMEMVDRDLLAVAWSKKNAEENSLTNVHAYGSLGFNRVQGKYDWILCNVPARIGEPFIKNLIHLGCARLNTGGELRVVVINDLVPMVSEMKLIAKGPRHSIYSISASEFSPSNSMSAAVSDEMLYLRDRVKVGELELDRPFDLGGDDQKRLKVGLPVLLDTLPRQVPSQQKTTSGALAEFRILCFRTGYGQIPLTCLKRWPQASVIAVDRDLLGTSFVQYNTDRLELSKNLEIRESAHWPDAIQTDEKFNLILGELSPSADEAVALSELRAMESSLTIGGEALILCLDKIEKDWVKKFATKSKLSIFKVLSRESYTVVRLTKNK
jgi:16S rRNA (guanine1207-N2)-methyltransferase